MNIELLESNYNESVYLYTYKTDDYLITSIIRKTCNNCSYGHPSIVIKNNEEKYIKVLNKNNIKYCENLSRFIRGNERNIEIINLNFHELINIFFAEQLLP